MFSTQENIQHINRAETCDIGHEAKDAAPAASRRWYVLRYKIMSGFCKEILHRHSSKIFFPHRTVSKVREIKRGVTKTEHLEQPLIPGYIFVNTTLGDAMAIGQEAGLNLWRKRAQDADGGKGCEYHTISDASMRQFKCAVELTLQDFKLLDAGCIDLAKDDLVEITAEGFNRQRGYIKYVNKQNDGLVVVPLTDESDGAPTTLFCYGIPVRSSDVALVSFAEGSRRATDLLNHASKAVTELMEEYKQGKRLTAQQETRLMGYVHRFRRLELERPIQRARHALMFYRIYTILEFATERDQMRKLLEETILPECEQRKNKAASRNRASAEKTYGDYLALKHDADNALVMRRDALSNQKPLSLRRRRTAVRTS